MTDSSVHLPRLNRYRIFKFRGCCSQNVWRKAFLQISIWWSWNFCGFLGHLYFSRSLLLLIKFHDWDAMYLPSTVAISANVKALMDILMMLRIDKYLFGILALMKACMIKTSPLRSLGILMKSSISSILLAELARFCCELLGVLLQSCTNLMIFLYQHLVTYSFALS